MRIALTLACASCLFGHSLAAAEVTITPACEPLKGQEAIHLMFKVNGHEDGAVLPSNDPHALNPENYTILESRADAGPREIPSMGTR